jgi:hypothetical protein
MRWQIRTNRVAAGAAIAVLLAVAPLPGAAGAAATAAQSASEQLRVLYPRAELLLRTGDVEGAIAALDRLIGLVEAEEVTDADADRLLLGRAYELRATLRWEEGVRRGVDNDLDGRFPADALIDVDGRRLEELPDLLPVLAGDHVVTGSKPGFAPAREQVRVRANRTEGVGIELSRSSATLRLVTRPPGAMLAVDGNVIGLTEAAAPDGAVDALEEAPIDSLPLVVDGLLPGFHEIEVTLAGYRSFRQQLEVPDLADYDLGVLELGRSLGTLLLRGLPSGASISIDGQPSGPEGRQPADGPIDSLRLSMTIGQHSLLVDGGRAGIFEANFSIDDGDTTALDVAVRPAIAWLGVFGGDPLDRDATRSLILPELQAVEGWAVLDRSTAGAALPARAEVGAAELLAGDREAWRRIAGQARETMRAGVFAAAVLAGEAPAANFELRVWGADEALAGEVLRVDLGTGEGLAPLIDTMREPLPVPRAWFGAQLMDDPAGGAVVIDLSDGSPAALAGLAFGDRISAFDGVSMISAGAVRRRLASSDPFAGVVLEVSRDGSAREILINLGSSPFIPAPRDVEGFAVIVAAAAASEAVRVDSTLPAWSLELLQARLILDAGAAERALTLLDRLAPPPGVPFGPAAAEYWRAQAALALPEPQREFAIAALQRAAGYADGRLGHNDGHRVAPLAQALLRALQER